MIDNDEGSIATFTPALRVDDEYLSFWLQNVTVRLRREICWNLRERSFLMDPQTHGLVPSANLFVSKGLLDLNQVKYWQEKQKFFQSDVTARYLTALLQSKVPRGSKIVYGSFHWLVKQLNLDDVSIFVISLLLACHLDSAVGNVISLCLNDPSKTQATLGLAQKLWDHPEQILFLTDLAGILFRLGILQFTSNIGINTNFNNVFDLPLIIAPLVANQLIFPSTNLPSVLRPIEEAANDTIELDRLKYISAKIKNRDNQKVLTVPILGIGKSSRLEAVANISKAVNKKVVEFMAADDRQFIENQSYLGSVMTICWLRNVDLFLDMEAIASHNTADSPQGSSFFLPLTSLPITTYLGISERDQLFNIPKSIMTQVIEVPTLSYSDRVDYWIKTLGDDYSKGIEKNSIVECCRRFRFDKESIDNVCRTLRGLPRPIDYEDLLTACWLEADVDMGKYAQRVIPRFSSEELILPKKQRLHFTEIINAMKSLTRVHYEWDTSKVWNEAGISVLFAGPSGTGKTMAAEILSKELGLPMFRIDLSQVVNKYIGETEKNLKKIFDKAEICDMILFFDEADSIFGRRVDTKDAHDRYANLEVNYLLERMERYKGLAILATNRIKEIDEAFLRRIRYTIVFEEPNVSQREIMWSQTIPSSIDSSKIDIEFLAKQFQLSGGNIRSIVFNASLQSARGLKSSSSKGEITMESIIIAIKREYDKIKRAVTMEQFGPYRNIVERLDKE